jgi:hypothetical protein
MLNNFSVGNYFKKTELKQNIEGAIWDANKRKKFEDKSSKILI